MKLYSVVWAQPYVGWTAPESELDLTQAREALARIMKL